jgi:hypothetical protein
MVRMGRVNIICHRSLPHSPTPPLPHSPTPFPQKIELHDSNQIFIDHKMDQSRTSVNDMLSFISTYHSQLIRLYTYQQNHYDGLSVKEKELETSCGRTANLVKYLLTDEQMIEKVNLTQVTQIADVIHHLSNNYLIQIHLTSSQPVTWETLLHCNIFSDYQQLKQNHVLTCIRDDRHQYKIIDSYCGQRKLTIKDLSQSQFETYITSLVTYMNGGINKQQWCDLFDIPDEDLIIDNKYDLTMMTYKITLTDKINELYQDCLQQIPNDPFPWDLIIFHGDQAINENWAIGAVDASIKWIKDNFKLSFDVCEH